MWILPKPKVDDVDDHLAKALTVKGKPVYVLSAEERAAVFAVYRAYDSLLGQPHPCLTPTVLDECAVHIRNGYRRHVQSGGRLAALRASLLNISDTCPYCGFGEPTELDHYLPKSEFEELAIYPRNLIPSCSACNKAKGALVPGKEPDASLIHAYFQVLPDVKFMRADVSFTANTLNVTFRIEGETLNPQLATMLEFQLERFKLSERYDQQLNKFLSEQRAGFRLFKKGGLSHSHVTEYLLESKKVMAEIFGLNDWRPVLMEGLAANKEFCAAPEKYLG